MGEEKRHEMMQNLFGDQSEEDEEIDSEHESNPHPNYASVILLLSLIVRFSIVLFANYILFSNVN